MVGCWGCGWLGGRYRQQHLLGWLYLVRSVAIAAFFVQPKTEISVIVFAVTMGFAWLGTVPLTSGLVAKMAAILHFAINDAPVNGEPVNGEPLTAAMPAHA